MENKKFDIKEFKCYMGDAKPILFKDILKEQDYSLLNSSDLSFIVGCDENRNIIIDDLEKIKSMVVVGNIGKGKTCFIHTLLASLFSKESLNVENKFLLIDVKGVELRCFAHNKNVTRVYEMVDIENMLKSVKEEILKRQTENKENSNIIIVVEEFVDLFYYDNKTYYDLFSFIINHGPKLGVYIIMTTQGVYADFIPKQFYDLFLTKVSFHLDSLKDCQKVGVLDASKLLGNGDMLYYRSGITKHLQGAYIEMRT